MSQAELQKILSDKLGGHVSFSGWDGPFPQIEVEQERLFKTLKSCIETSELSFDFLETIIAIDQDSHLEIIYRVFSTKNKVSVNLFSKLKPNSHHVQSVSPLWRAALAFESEIYELFGIEFKSPVEELKKQFLPKGWVGYPLLKKYQYPAEFLEVKHERIVVQRQMGRHGVTQSK